MKMNYLLFATLLLLCACEDRSAPTPKIAAPQREALEKAKKTEQMMQEKAEESQKKLDEAGK